LALICNLPSLQRKLSLNQDDIEDAKPVLEDEVQLLREQNAGTLRDRAKSEEALAMSPGLREPYSQLNLNDLSERGATEGTDEVAIPECGQTIRDGPGTTDALDSQTTTTSGVFNNAQESSPTSKRKKKRKSSGPPPRKYKSDDFKIIILDSMGMSHSKTVSNLKLYIAAEGNDKRSMAIDPKVLSSITAKGIPEQNNFSDCGIYVCGYLDKFMQNPKAFGQKLLAQELDAHTDWPDMDPNQMRKNIREMLQKIYAEQDLQRVEEKRAKKDAKRRAKLASRQSDASSPPTSANLLESDEHQVANSEIVDDNRSAAYTSHTAPKRPADTRTLPLNKEGSPTPAKRSRYTSPEKRELAVDDKSRLDFNPTLANVSKEDEPADFLEQLQEAAEQDLTSEEEFRGFDSPAQSPQRPSIRSK
jgi:sentrin-specific protease 7